VRRFQAYVTRALLAGEMRPAEARLLIQASRAIVETLRADEATLDKAVAKVKETLARMDSEAANQPSGISCGVPRDD
jgi:hypothetical protein